MLECTPHDPLPQAPVHGHHKACNTSYTRYAILTTSVHNMILSAAVLSRLASPFAKPFETLGRVGTTH